MLLLLVYVTAHAPTGGKCAKLRDAEGCPTGQRCLYSLVGALDPAFQLPDDRLLCVPTNDKEKDLAFPSPAAAGWGNAAFLSLCMKLAYEVRNGKDTTGRDRQQL